MGFTLVGSAGSTIERSDLSVLYRDVFPGTDLRYEIGAGTVKDKLVWHRRPL